MIWLKTCGLATTISALAIALGFDKIVFFVVEVVVVVVTVEVAEVVVVLTSGLFDKILIKASSGLCNEILYYLDMQDQ